MTLDIASLGPEKRLALKDVLVSEGFEFEKRRHKKPGTKEIVVHTAGTRVLNREKYKKAIIGIDFDAEKDHWFVAQSWEDSQLHSIKIHEIEDGDMKLTAVSLILNIEAEFGRYLSGIPSPKKEHELVTEPEVKPEPVISDKKIASWEEEQQLKILARKREQGTKGQEEEKQAIKGKILSDITEPTEQKTPDPVEEKPAEEAAEDPEIVPARVEPSATDVINPEQMQIMKTVGAKVSLTKNSKGYTWEITSHKDTMAAAIEEVIAADMRLKTQFGGVA